MNNIEKKIMSLYIGSPRPNPYHYQIGIIDALFNLSEEEFKKENKRRLKLYKKALQKYNIERKKELQEVEKLINGKK